VEKIMLNTQKALELYLLLKDHFPFEKSEFDIIQLIRIIIDSMVKKGQYKNYTRAITLMHGIELEVMKESNPEDLVSLFAEGFLENDIVELMRFFNEKVRYGIPK